MQIQPQFMNLASLLNGRIFRIPEYQRAYSWGKKQRDDLFCDIKKLRNTDKGHFLATMVGLHRDVVRIAADDFRETEVVDGQQRLTTITILLRAIKNKIDKAPNVSGKLSSELQDLLVKGDGLNVLLLQSNHDSSHIFVDYIREGKLSGESAVRTSADKNIMDAISECEIFVDEWAKKSDIVDLLATLKNKLYIIFHEIEDESIVYTVFEVLNSRGLDVTWFDKCKALLMGVVFEHGDDGGKKITIGELHTIWKDIYRAIGTRQTLNRETLRFAATLSACDKPSKVLSEEIATDELMVQCGKSSKKAIEISKWLLSVCEAESRLLDNHRLRAVTQIVQARLAAISIILRNFEPSDEKNVLQTWENVTFLIYGLAAKDARTAVGDFVRLAWRVRNENLNPKQIITELKEVAKDTIDLSEAYESLVEKDLYPGQAELIRYFFYRYDEYLASQKGQKINDSKWNRIWAEEPAKSIEHIKPQSSQVSYLHHLGNLTMLPPGVNSKLKDIKPSEKSETYKDCGLADCAEVAKLIEKSGWDAKSVKIRTGELLHWARSAWKI